MAATKTKRTPLESLKLNNGLTQAQRQVIQDKEQLSKEERDAQIKEYIESRFDPSKTSTLSQTELLALAALSDEETQIQYKKWMEEAQSKSGKKLYKYNINQSGVNSLLEDLRNFKNFRTSWDEYPNNESTILFGVGGRQAATSPSKSFYMSAGDFLFSESLNLNANALYVPEVQPIILNEFQPYNQVYWLSTLISVAKNLVSFGTQGSDSGSAKAIGVFKNLLGNNLGKDLMNKGKALVMNYLTRKFSLNPGLLYDRKETGKPGMTSSSPIWCVKNMFKAGNWLNTYELPFFGPNSNMYLIADQYKNWKTGGIGQALGEDIQKLAQDQITMDFPTSPTFGLTSVGSATYPEISIEFYLINKDNYWLDRNFRFLTAFYAGTQWLQMTGRIYKR